MKKRITIRLDEDIIEWFRSSGSGYQTRMNDALRDYMWGDTRNISSIKAGVAPTAEQLICNQSVEGSNPSISSKKKVPKKEIISGLRETVFGYSKDRQLGKRVKHG